MLRPILLVTTIAQRRLIACACERSLSAGVRPGMTLAHARALLPPGEGAEAIVEEFDPRRDLAALHALAAWAARFSPLVAPDPPDGLRLDITGCERVFRGERRLAQQLARAVERLGFSARAAVGPTLGCAWAVARFGIYNRAVVPPGRARDAVAGLPIRALRIDEKTEAALVEVGIERIEHLLALPRDQLPARFGDDLLLRLDQATREDDGGPGEVIEPVRPADPVRTHILFDGPTTRVDAVHAGARHVLAGLCASLARFESGARLVELTLARVDADSVRLAVTLSRPSRSERHLWSLLYPLLEKANLGFGVDGLSARAERVVRLAHEQEQWWHGSPNREVEGTRLGEPCHQLIDALTGRLGEAAVSTLDSIETHIPERAFALRPAMAGAGLEARKASRHRGIEASSRPRPTILFDRPEPARVLALVPDGPPSLVAWRNRDRRIVASLGPERLAEEWWRTTGCLDASMPRCLSSRDYFTAQDDRGLWLWVYRESETARWFVHGVWG